MQLLILLILLKMPLGSNQTSLEQLRKDYYLAVNDAKLTQKLYDKLRNLPNPNPIELGYLGGVEALRAKHSWNPYNKMQFVANANKTLTTAIEKAPNLIELRFIRFSYQHYLPNMLGLSNEINEDLQKIVSLIMHSNYNPNDKELIKNIIAFLIETKRLSNEDKQALNSHTI